MTPYLEIFCLSYFVSRHLLSLFICYPHLKFGGLFDSNLFVYCAEFKE